MRDTLCHNLIAILTLNAMSIIVMLVVLVTQTTATDVTKSIQGPATINVILHICSSAMLTTVEYEF